MPFAVPVGASLTQSGAGGNHRDIPFGVGRAFVKHDEIAGLESRDAVRISFQIVDQGHVIKPQQT